MGYTVRKKKNYRQTQQSSKTLCCVKRPEARVITVWFYLYEIWNRKKLMARNSCLSGRDGTWQTRGVRESSGEIKCFKLVWVLIAWLCTYPKLIVLDTHMPHLTTVYLKPPLQKNIVCKGVYKKKKFNFVFLNTKERRHISWTVRFLAKSGVGFNNEREGG